MSYLKEVKKRMFGQNVFSLIRHQNKAKKPAFSATAGCLIPYIVRAHDLALTFGTLAATSQRLPIVTTF